MVERPRALIVLPEALESAVVADRLTADGVEAVRRPTAQSGAAELRTRSFDVLIADAAVAFRHSLHIQARARNPLTVTILIGDVANTRPGDGSTGQIMYLARPIDCPTLACFVSMALVDGRPVRRSQRKVANRFEASVNGISSRIVDVSLEGLRLEVPRESRAALPPYFTVRVPIAGVSVTVRRMWTRASGREPSCIWYGGELSHNRALVDQTWRTFVENLPSATASAVHVAL